MKTEIWMIFSMICSGIFFMVDRVREAVAFHSGNFGGGFRGAGFGGGSGSYGRSTYGGGYTMKGQDTETQMDVTFDEAAFGCDKVITLQNGEGAGQPLKVHIPAESIPERRFG